MYRSSFSLITKIFTVILLILSSSAYCGGKLASKGIENEQNWRTQLFPYPHQLKWQGQVAIDVKKLVLLTPASPSKILAKSVEDVSREIFQLCGQKPKTT
ncbi:MAG: hypothetical protein ACYSSI_02885, partial [Planctomycetota bacterium]